MELVSIDSLNPSAYNPRKSDEERLNLVELSLRKLGFLIPIYATFNGEIISGHQRHHVATRMGFEEVPVQWIDKELTLEKRKNINILFNQSTNEVPRKITPAKMKEKIDSIDLLELIKGIDDKEMDKPEEVFRCLYSKKVDIQKLIDKNYLKFDKYYANKNYNLMKVIKSMPIVINEDYDIINGLGRVYNLINKTNRVDSVIINNNESEFAFYMLNYVSMDFDIHNKYRDELRQNSFRRKIIKRDAIGSGYVAKLVKKPSKVGSVFSKQLKEAFRKEYGDRILDFGAGHLDNCKILKNNGFDCIPFEPFIINFDNYLELDYKKSKEVCKDFIYQYLENPHFDTIFLHSVFNSVPFEEDRKKILTILSEIASKDTKIIIWTRHVGPFLSFLKREKTENDHMGTKTVLDYEKNITLGDSFYKPKVQKYYGEKELIELCSSYFKDIRTAVICGMLYCQCTLPIKPSLKDLDDALDFEFNLKHIKDGNLGLNDLAKEVFHKVRKRRVEEGD